MHRYDREIVPSAYEEIKHMNKTNVFYSIIPLSIASVLMTGCVSNSTHEIVVNELQVCQVELSTCQSNLSVCSVARQTLTEQNGVLQQELQTKNNQLESTQGLLNAQYTNYTNCVNAQSSSESEVRRLNSELNSANSELTDRIQQLELSESTINLLRQTIAKQREAVTELTSKLKAELESFSGDLTVEIRDGKVYVAMSDKLLFKSGSVKIEEAGKQALEQLASVIKNSKDIDIFIEGHTDNVPISTNRFVDNWDLSVIRATSITRLLIDEYGLNPSRLVPSGRGEHYPVHDNETPEGRALNRRTEIVLAPNLDEMRKILSSLSE